MLNLCIVVKVATLCLPKKVRYEETFTIDKCLRICLFCRLCAGQNYHWYGNFRGRWKRHAWCGASIARELMDETTAFATLHSVFRDPIRN